MLFPFRDDVPHRNFPLLVCVLIAVNVLTFLWFLRMDDRQQNDFVLRHAFIPVRIGQLQTGQPIRIRREALMQDRAGRLVRVPQVEVLLPDHREIVASIFTSMFLHAGWAHLLGNMWFLWLFGANVEDRLGSARFVLFYLGGGLVAVLVQWLDDPGSTVPTLGASGAIAAVLGGYAITYPWARIHTLVFIIIFFTVIDLPALLFLGGWFIYQLVAAKTEMGGGVAWWAHAGGFVAGLALMPWLDPHRGEPAPDERPMNEIETGRSAHTS